MSLSKQAKASKSLPLCLNSKRFFSATLENFDFYRTLVVFSDSDMSKKITGVHEINDS